MSEKKKLQLAKLDLNAPIDEMPDCKEKFDKILYEASQAGGKKFTDV